MVKYEYVKANLNVIRTLVRSGDISGRIISFYKVYEVFLSYHEIESKMDRYSMVSEDTGMPMRTVMKAVKSMETKVG